MPRATPPISSTRSCAVALLLCACGGGEQAPGPAAGPPPIDALRSRAEAPGYAPSLEDVAVAHRAGDATLRARLLRAWLRPASVEPAAAIAEHYERLHRAAGALGFPHAAAMASAVFGDEADAATAEGVLADTEALYVAALRDLAPDSFDTAVSSLRAETIVEALPADPCSPEAGPLVRLAMLRRDAAWVRFEHRLLHAGAPPAPRALGEALADALDVEPSEAVTAAQLEALFGAGAGGPRERLRRGLAFAATGSCDGARADVEAAIERLADALRPRGWAGW